jgi:hypothetical protein
MCDDNELYCQYREWVAKSAEQHPSLASALASSVLAPQVKRGHLPFATRFLRISFYQFCFSLSFRCLRSFSLTFFDAVSHACVHARLPCDFHFFAFTTFTRVLFQTRKIGLRKSHETSAGNLVIATLFKKRFVKSLKFVRKVLVTTWYKERYAEICEGCESKKA